MNCSVLRPVRSTGQRRVRLGPDGDVRARHLAPSVSGGLSDVQLWVIREQLLHLPSLWGLSPEPQTLRLQRPGLLRGGGRRGRDAGEVAEGARRAEDHRLEDQEEAGGPAGGRQPASPKRPSVSSVWREEDQSQRPHHPASRQRDLLFQNRPAGPHRGAVADGEERRCHHRAAEGAGPGRTQRPSQREAGPDPRETSRQAARRDAGNFSDRRDGKRAEDETERRRRRSEPAVAEKVSEEERVP